MSGGSFNYVFCKDVDEVMLCTQDLKDIRDELIHLGYPDVAKDVQRLIEYVESSKIVISTLQEKLKDILHDVEWCADGNITNSQLAETIEKYRKQIS